MVRWRAALILLIAARCAGWERAPWRGMVMNPGRGYFFGTVEVWGREIPSLRSNKDILWVSWMVRVNIRME